MMKYTIVMLLKILSKHLNKIIGEKGYEITNTNRICYNIFEISKRSAHAKGYWKID